jgi:hypothetical protein
MKKAYGRALPAAWRGFARVFIDLGGLHRQRIVLLFDPGERHAVGRIVAASTPSRPAFVAPSGRGGSA